VRPIEVAPSTGRLHLELLTGGRRLWLARSGTDSRDPVPEPIGPGLVKLGSRHRCKLRPYCGGRLERPAV
jgi:hypothetical protein